MRKTYLHKGHEAEHDDVMGNAALFCGIQCTGIMFELATEHRREGQGRRSRKRKVRVVEAGEHMEVCDCVASGAEVPYQAPISNR